jgi:hypothetical protein
VDLPEPVQQHEQHRRDLLYLLDAKDLPELRQNDAKPSSSSSASWSRAAAFVLLSGDLVPPQPHQGHESHQGIPLSRIPLLPCSIHLCMQRFMISRRAGSR